MPDGPARARERTHFGMNTTEELTPPSQDSGSMLQPLREVGTLHKTQFWDLDEIYQALREANRLGIAPERLFQTVAEPKLAHAS